MLIPFGIFSAGAGGGGGGAGSYDLISTTILGSSAASVTFDVTGLGATYKHLQIRMTPRTDRASFSVDELYMRFNSDTGSNYASHMLYGTGSSVGSLATTTQTYSRNLVGAGSTAPSSVFGAGVIDILDAFSTTKNKTNRALTGALGSGENQIRLSSGVWMSTSATTSVSLGPVNGTNFVSGSRFSLYGIKG
jgi:hypothetical protein